MGETVVDEMALALCPSCRRHVRVAETSCPFCASKLPKLVARHLELPRMSRAAIVAAVVAASGCRDKAPVATADPTATTTAADAGDDTSSGTTDPTTTDTGADADADADDAVHMHHPPVSKYGAPPHPYPLSRPKYGAPPPPDVF